MAKDVKFNIKLNIDGKEHIVTASTNVKKLASDLGIARDKSAMLRDSLLAFSSVTYAFQSVFNGIQQITGMMQQYTAAFAVQQEAETKLANNMRNTMAAREEDIQSIKDLCTAQQQLGVIGDEVQLAGAQQLATFLSQKASLEALIPVMNDMIAKEGGLNASASDAESAASMLGKALNGTTTSLERAGYFLTESQKSLLQYGTEEQKVAVLTEAIEARVGGMNAELAKTDAGRAKQASNEFGDLKERIGEAFSAIEPTIIKVGQLGLALTAISTTTSGIMSVVRAMRALQLSSRMATVATLAQNAATKVGAAIQALWTRQAALGRVANIAWANSARTAAIQAGVMRVAILGLMAVTGVGIAIAAVAGIISMFASNTDDATDALEEHSEAAKRAKEIADEQKEREDAATQAYTNASSALKMHTARLKELIDQKKAGKDVSKEEKKIVGELNNAYGETMGYFATVSAWYDALIANSEAYCRQMVLEAKTRTLANQIAAKEQERDKIRQKIEAGEYSTQREYAREEVSIQSYHMGLQGGTRPTAQEIVGTSELDKAQQRVSDLDSDIQGLNEDMKSAVTEASNLEFKVKGSATAPTLEPKKTGGTSGNKELSLVENAKTYKDLANNVSYYQQEIEKCDIKDTERLQTLARQKKAAEEAVQAFKDMTDAVSVPSSFASLEDYDKALQDLRKKRNTATAEQITALDREIAKVEDERKAFEFSALAQSDIARLEHNQITTRDQLSAKTAYYNTLMAQGTEADRKRARAGLDALDEISDGWDAVIAKSQFALDSMGEVDVSRLNSRKDIDAAISLYTEQQSKEDADRAQQTQAIINRLTERKRVIELSVDIPEMQKEVADLQNLSKKEYRVKVRDMGFDTLTEKIRELNELLSRDDITDNQRSQLESLRGSYEDMRHDAVTTFSTLQDGWSGVKSIGNGIQSMTEALEGNGNAWQKATAMVDAFISIMTGISTVVGIINMLTEATAGHTVAKGAEATAIGASTVAEGVEVKASEATALATVPVIAANKAETSSFMELAAAMYMAAHASIPFAGFEIGSGFATSAVALVQGIGLMPFAKGGVVSGPTMALIGEYAGATNNPEVVAPLDKLRTMIQPANEINGKVRFKIVGRNLEGVLEKENRLNYRS